MDFQRMKRKQLQALCKKHNIPANLSNLQLAQNLSSLLQEKEKPAKRVRPSSKAVVETVEENDSGVTTRQSKKVRFSPNSEMFEFVRSGRKGKTKVMTTKSEMEPAAKKLANTVAEKVDAVESNEEVMGKVVRSLRSRVIASAGGGVIPVVNPPVEKKRARKVGKDVDEVESGKEFVISSVRVMRSTVQTSTEDGIIPVSKQLVEKKRVRGLIKDVEVVGSSPVRVTRSRAQISMEGGEVLALKPQVEKKRARGVVKDVDPAKDIVDGPVRTTRSRAQTSKEGIVATMPSSPVEKKRARTGIKVGAKTIKLTDADLDIPVKLVSQEAAADRAEDLPLKRTLRQRKQKQAAAKGDVKVCEDEPLATDIGMTEQKLCLRRMTRIAVRLGDSTVLNRSTDETEMGGRGKITRSRNQLAQKDNSDMKTETAVMDQRKSEVMLQAGEPLRRTGRNCNRRKSVMPQETGNGVIVQGTSQMVPKLEEPVRHPTRKGSKQYSIVPKVDEMETTELMAEKGDILKENEMVVPAVGPIRRSRRQTLQLESIALTDEDLPSRVTAGRKRPGNQSNKGFKPKVLVKGLRQNASGGKFAVPSAARINSSMKQRGALEEQAIDIKCAPLVEESPIRFSGSATKNESNVGASNSEKVVRKKQQHSRTKTPNLLVRTPSPEEISDIKGQPCLDAQFCMPQVTKSSSDHVSGSSQVIKISSSKNRSEARKTRSSKQGVEEAKGQTSASKSERFQTEDVGTDKEISMRKQRGEFIVKEDVEKSSRRLTRSAITSEKNTEPDLPAKSARKKVHSSSRPPMLIADEDLASYGKPSIGAKFSVPEVLKGPSDLFAGCTDVIKDDSSRKSPKSCRSTRSSKQAHLLKVHAETSDVEETKGKVSSSKSGSSRAYDQQEGTEISVRKRRGSVAFQEMAVDSECALPAEESSRRLTRSALKSEKSAPGNPTEKSAGKKKRLNRSEAPKLDVKISSADRNLAAHGLANLDPQFLSPKDLESATVPVGVVIDESSSKKRKKLFSGASAENQDGTEDVYAQISLITEGKSPILNLEETLASESERLQIDDLEKEIVDSINETMVASEVNVMQGQIFPSDESLCGTNASKIELATEIELSSIQNSPGQFTSTVMSEPESPNLAMEVPSELGPSALEAVSSIAVVPEPPEGTNNLGLGRDDIIEDNSTCEMKKSSLVFQVVGEGSSDEVHTEPISKREANVLVNRVALSASEPVRLQDGSDPQMEISVGEAVLFAANMNMPIEVIRDFPGSQSRDRTKLSTKLTDQETVEDLSIADDADFAQTASYSPTKVKEMDEPSTGKDEDSSVGARSIVSANQDNNNFTKEQNPEIDDNEKIAESAEPHESSSSPVRQSIELDVSSTEKSHAIDKLPIQVPVTIENATITLLSSSEEPPELGDGKGMVSTTSLYSEKQESVVDVYTDEVEDSVSLNLEKIKAFNLHTLQREHKVADLDLAMESPNSNVNSTDQNSGYPEAVEHSRKNCDAAITGSVHGFNVLSVYKADDTGLEKKMEYASVEDDMTFFQNKQEFFESPGLNEGCQKVGCESSPSTGRNEQKSVESADLDDVSPIKEHDYYQLKDLFETPASRVHSCEEETSMQVTEMARLVLSRDKTPSSLESRDKTPLQRSLNATIDNESMEERNALSTAGEDIFSQGLVGDWHEDTLQSFDPTPATGNCISSKDAPPCGSLAFSDNKTRKIERNGALEDYFERHLESEIETYNPFAPLDASNFDGDEENIHVYGGSNSVEAGENDLKEAVSDEKARNVDEFSDEQLHNNKGVNEEGHVNSSIGCWASNKPSYGTEVQITTDKTDETDDFPCSLTDANTSAVLGEQRILDLKMKSQMFSTQEANCSPSDNKGDEAEKSSSVLSWEFPPEARENSTSLCAEEQFGETEKNIKQFYGGTSDVTYCEYELAEGFNVGGDTEEYFESENTRNANVKESFDGMTQDEFLMEIDHEYTVLPEPGMGGEISRMEAKDTATVDGDTPMDGQTCEEREEMQLGEAPSLMNSRTEAPEMFSGTDTSPGSVHFALDKGM